DRVVQVKLDRAFEDVEGGGSVLALAHEDLAGAVALAGDGAGELVPDLLADAGEVGDGRELVGRENVAAEVCRKDDVFRHSQEWARRNSYTIGPVSLPEAETRDLLASWTMINSRRFMLGTPWMAEGSAASAATLRGPAEESMQRPRALKMDWAQRGMRVGA